MQGKEDPAPGDAAGPPGEGAGQGGKSRVFQHPLRFFDEDIQLLRALDGWRKSQRLSRTAAILLFIEEALARRELWPPPPSPLPTPPPPQDQGGSP